MRPCPQPAAAPTRALSKLSAHDGVQAHSGLAGRAGLSRPEAGGRTLPRFPESRARGGLGATARSAAHDRAGVQLALALRLSGLGAGDTPLAGSSPPPPAPFCADVAVPPQPMAVASLCPAAPPPRFKSESPRLSELRMGPPGRARLGEHPLPALGSRTLTRGPPGQRCVSLEALRERLRLFPILNNDRNPGPQPGWHFLLPLPLSCYPPPGAEGGRRPGRGLRPIFLPKRELAGGAAGQGQAGTRCKISAS